MGSTRRNDVIAELLAAMRTRDSAAVLTVLRRRTPTHAEVAAASVERRRDLALEVLLGRHPVSP